jgi:hypothetical protein
MEEELDTSPGKKTSVKENTQILAVKNGEPCGTKNVEKDIITLHAVSAHQIAHQVSLILEFHAKKIPMVEELEAH